jgi:hypothetical protein
MTNISWEKFVRKTLRDLARQRMMGVVQPGNLWLILGGPSSDEETFCAIQTAIMRGWVSIVHSNIPSGEVQRPELGLYRSGSIYGLTDSGWRVVHNEFWWIVVAAVSGILGVVIATLAYLTVLLKV